VPLQPPVAVQVVEFFEVHDSCDEPPDATLVGAALSVTDGQGITVPLTRFATVPPSPLQVSHRSTQAPAVNGPTLAVPDVALAPVHPPLAAHVFAYVVVQFTVKKPFTVLDPVNVSVGADTAYALLDKVRTSAAVSQRGRRVRPKRGDARSCIILRFTVRARGKGAPCCFVMHLQTSSAHGCDLCHRTTCNRGKAAKAKRSVRGIHNRR